MHLSHETASLVSLPFDPSLSNRCEVTPTVILVGIALVISGAEGVCTSRPAVWTSSFEKRPVWLLILYLDCLVLHYGAAIGVSFFL